MYRLRIHYHNGALAYLGLASGIEVVTSTRRNGPDGEGVMRMLGMTYLTTIIDCTKLDERQCVVAPESGV